MTGTKVPCSCSIMGYEMEFTSYRQGEVFKHMLKPTGPGNILNPNAEDLMQGAIPLSTPMDLNDDAVYTGKSQILNLKPTASAGKMWFVSHVCFGAD